MREIVKGGIYRHFKGDYYLVETLAKDCETTEPVVVYRQLYGNGELWDRPHSSFMAQVHKKKYPDVKQVYRFEYQEVKSVK